MVGANFCIFLLPSLLSRLLIPSITLFSFPFFPSIICTDKSAFNIVAEDHNGQLNLADILTIQDVGGVEHLVHNGPLLLFRVRFNTIFHQMEDIKSSF
jgi:hypothetical protein